MRILFANKDFKVLNLNLLPKPLRQHRKVTMFRIRVATYKQKG